MQRRPVPVPGFCAVLPGRHDTATAAPGARFVAKRPQNLAHGLPALFFGGRPRFPTTARLDTLENHSRCLPLPHRKGEEVEVDAFERGKGPVDEVLATHTNRADQRDEKVQHLRGNPPLLAAGRIDRDLAVHLMKHGPAILRELAPALALATSSTVDA